MPEKDTQEKKWEEQPEGLGDSFEQGSREGASWEKEQKQEKRQEQITETESEPSPEKEEESAPEKEESYDGASSPPPVDPARQREKQIEKILEKDLVDTYLELDSQKQEEFKQKGEETARKINVLLNKTKVKSKKIVDLIKKWLSLLPGANKFFLEQEAKKKTDDIIKLKNNNQS